ncbi:MAG: hypothetical protein RLZZ502_1571, partial [Pseudomonadota bacterium]
MRHKHLRTLCLCLASVVVIFISLAPFIYVLGTSLK